MALEHFTNIRFNVKLSKIKPTLQKQTAVRVLWLTFSPSGVRLRNLHRIMLTYFESRHAFRKHCWVLDVTYSFVTRRLLLCCSFVWGVIFPPVLICSVCLDLLRLFWTHMTFSSFAAIGNIKIQDLNNYIHLSNYSWYVSSHDHTDLDWFWYIRNILRHECEVTMGIDAPRALKQLRAEVP